MLSSYHYQMLGNIIDALREEGFALSQDSAAISIKHEPTGVTVHFSGYDPLDRQLLEDGLAQDSAGEIFELAETEQENESKQRRANRRSAAQ